MGFTTINPASGEMLRRYPFMSGDALDTALTTAQKAQRAWAAIPIEERARTVAGLAAHLRTHDSKLAQIVTMEMGKPLGEAVMEVDKCASGCEHYGELGPAICATRRSRPNRTGATSPSSPSDSFLRSCRGTSPSGR